MKSFVLFFVSVWSVLSLLFIPFSFQFLPQIGVQLSNLIFPINDKICSLFGVNVENSFLVSDSLASFSTGFILLIFSLFFTIIIHWKGKMFWKQTQNVSFFILILFLSYFLLHYGLDKLFGLQFYPPAPNTLHTPVGDLDKDILFWTSMGTSPFYNQFMAIIEITSGFLLLINKTRFLALLVSFGIFLNIFAINIGFDITVKYLSFLLLVSSLVGLFFYIHNIRFLLGKTINTKAIAPYLSQWILLVLFLPFLTDLAVTYWNVKERDSGKSFTVHFVNGKSQFIDVENICRIHIHPENYLIIENNQQKFTSYKLSNNQTLMIIKNHKLPIMIQKNQLSWMENNSKISLTIEAINLKTMPLNRGGTHWYFEDF